MLGRRAWRRRFVLVPQLHDNHLFSESLAFNLLLGRGWPATDRDLEDARELCGELGLEELLRSMPGGLDTIVGEVGWQLSQGERARVFLARALLQDAELVVIDESFASLDPDSIRIAMRVVRKRARSLMVIAHP